MFCQKFGIENAGNASFCSSCGTRLGMQSITRMNFKSTIILNVKTVKLINDPDIIVNGSEQQSMIKHANDQHRFIMISL